MHKRLRQRCTCQIYGCSNNTEEDPDTHLVVQGQLLPPSTTALHRHENKIWLAGQQNQSPESVLLANILARPNSQEDYVVDARAAHVGQNSNVDVEAFGSSIGEELGLPKH